MNGEEGPANVYQEFGRIVEESSMEQCCVERLIEGSQIPGVARESVMFQDSEVGEDGSIDENCSKQEEYIPPVFQ